MNRLCLFILAILLYAPFMSRQALAQSIDADGIDPEALVERIVAVYDRQREQVQDVTFDAEYIEGEMKDGELKEKVRILKKVYIKYLSDTALFHEDYLEYYKEGKRQSEKDLMKEAADREKKKRDRGSRDISLPMVQPFLPSHRALYEITYLGVTEEAVEGYVCHSFKVQARMEEKEYINGEYYFDADSFHLVRVDFSPAKLGGNTFFRLKDMKMSLKYTPSQNGFWFPSEFSLQGRAKAMFFIGVKFAATEYYRNPSVNSELPIELFVEENENGD